MKFEIKQKEEHKDKVTYLSLRQSSSLSCFAGDIDVMAKNEVDCDLIMTFRNGKFKKYTIHTEMAESLGILREDFRIKEEV